jgi:uncharacterized protein YciI
MDGAVVVRREQRLRLRWDNRDFGIGAGEAADRIERLPQRDDREFDQADSAGRRASQDVRTAVAGNRGQLRERLLLQVADVRVGVLGARPAAPHPGNHPAIVRRMPHFALFYETAENFAERRQPYRQAHLALVDAAHREGRLLLAGALKPAAGALLVFRADDISDVERFAKNDPYVTNGLVTSWRVREWAVVVGEGAVPR